MTIKEQLIYEIEQSPDRVIEEVFDFLLLAKLKYHRQQQSKPFASFIQELVADIPPDILATLPADGSEQHDHYIYGTPKREL